MRRLVGISLALALAAAGCGGDDDEGGKIPAREADRISNQLDAIQEQADRGNCGSAAFQAREVGQKVESLPSEVSQDVRDALTDGVERLQAAIDNDCEEPEATTTEETTPETTETQPETTETQPETTETQPETTETQPETTTEEQPPPDDGGTPPGQDGTPPGQGNDGGAGIPGNGDEG